MGNDDITVRLWLRRVLTGRVLVDTPSRLEVEVSSSWSTSRCPWCGFRCRRVHDRRQKRIRDRMMSGRRVTLVWQRRRFECGNCGERHLEEHPEFEGNLTRRFARQLVADARVMPIIAVARREGLGWHKIMGLVSSWSELVAAHRRSRRCRVLLVDETSIQRGHKYVTVIKNGDTGHVLAMVEHRSAAALAGFLRKQPRSWRQKVKVVVTDGSRAYKTAVGVWLPHARHVLDRFHVVRWFAAGLTAARRDVQRRPGGEKPVFDPEVFGARFALLRRPDRLTPAQAARLERLFDRHPRLRTAWEALAELHGLYLAEDYPGALAALRRFADLYATGQIPEFHAVVDTVIAWGDEILAWHHTGRPSNGPLEGTNNLLQVLRRTAHGFTNPYNYAARGLLLT